jgi:amino acid transporter
METEGGRMASNRNAVTNMALVLLGLWLAAYLLILIPGGPVKAGSVSGFGVVAAAVVATAIVTFFGFLRLPPDTHTGISDGRLRFAIAASTIVTYLVFVGSAGLFQNGGELSELSRLLLTSFTTIVGVIIAFYFGSSAYVSARTTTAKKGSSDGS